MVLKTLTNLTENFQKNWNANYPLNVLSDFKISEHLPVGYVVENTVTGKIIYVGHDLDFAQQAIIKHSLSE